ncbi:hypothetical protein Pcinc_033376 [Petrolisthes cinctipes]|uniref:Uncharacterized protein n=1 Tax=Petrolisthes cinctipes TaxID=88211 RepID=A0AAE1ESJ6_PETCI|nr:hypothetical protein Pcinc_033376 [Petrolisthes cinctipes]
MNAWWTPKATQPTLTITTNVRMVRKCCQEQGLPSCCSVKPTTEAAGDQAKLWALLFILIFILGLLIWYCRHDGNCCGKKTRCCGGGGGEDGEDGGGGGGGGGCCGGKKGKGDDTDDDDDDEYDDDDDEIEEVKVPKTTAHTSSD